jgi:hypothetical protein
MVVLVGQKTPSLITVLIVLRMCPDIRFYLRFLMPSVFEQHRRLGVATSPTSDRPRANFDSDTMLGRDMETNSKERTRSEGSQSKWDLQQHYGLVWWRYWLDTQVCQEIRPCRWFGSASKSRSALAAFRSVVSKPPINFRYDYARPGYAGQIYLQAPIARFVPGHGIVGEPCDMPSTTCSNDYRISD